MRSYFGLILFFISITSFAQETDTATGEKEYTFFKGEKTTIKNPFELRDPFKEEMTRRAATKKADAKLFATMGQYSNLPTSENIPALDRVQVIGVLLGKERRALVRVIGGNKDVIILKEGAKVGPEGIELKAILPGGVVFVEKIRNVYDQDEYLETIIPVSAE